MRRLYVGGLSQSVTQKDLKDRFGKFGDVDEVELRTKRDEQGTPYKTFAYININISDAELKKCLTVLNKSKWKGGTLQIETAKESFLHRLAQERQAGLEKHQQQHAGLDMKQKLLDSLSRAGVENFTMKAAVPGTEVPGHKDWVVSKFGRVLPVLQLRCQKGNRVKTMKYDPSKYSHNIRKLDLCTAEGPASISQLTWEIKGGDDDISKKRRGEFSPYESSQPKKSRAQRVYSHIAVGRPRLDFTGGSAHQFIKKINLPTSQTQTQRSWTHLSGSEVDSEDEIHTLLAAQQSPDGALRREVDQDDVEVVTQDYLEKSRHKGEKEDDDDSADTGELFAFQRSTRQEKTSPVTQKPSKKKKKKKSRNAGKQEETCSSADDEGRHLISRNPPSPEHKGNSVRRRPWKQGSSSEQETNQAKEPSSNSDGDDEEDSDSEYEAMFSNVTRLEISLTDLQKVAESSQQASEASAAGVPDSCREKETNITSATVKTPTAKKGTTPEEILATIMKEDRWEREEKRKHVTWIPAFSGTRALREGAEKEEKPSESHREEDDGNETFLLNSKNCESESSSSTEERERRTEPVRPVAKASTESSSSSSSCSSEEDQDHVISAAKAHCSGAPHSEEQEEEEEAGVWVLLGGEEARQRRANLRRLAAVQQKQNQAEQHRKLIQEALANLDNPAAQTGKRIVFGSDDEELQSVSNAGAPKTTLFKDDDSEVDDMPATNQTAGIKERESGPQLFSSSEDEDGGDEDRSRFDIKPQFEGRAGQMLMALQSRFGTDERFRMDSRFLEEDEADADEDSEEKQSVREGDDTLKEERRRNLSILQSILSDGQPTCSKTTVKTKTFRDISALHYDPSRQEHAAFETKADETSSKSKAARRKKRGEAQKLPEVSKEIFYDVLVNLKAVFGPTKESVITDGQKTSWDQQDGGREQDEEFLSADPSEAKQDCSGFKFSFFGEDTQTGSREAAEYHVETIQRSVLSWQQEPHLHDSSSTEEEEVQEQTATVAAGSTEQEVTSAKELFFFYPKDHRLTEGPKLFCRSSQLEEHQEQWEETRHVLRQEYRKKHKDARRKLKSSHRS
ncbi:nucleolar protein 8 isoform X2 [Thalassophryne amazonica]|uniref:nucleolar protein 8 isoform X2 n=1 Tax=Thalassophryne amazonica TaxID=390379 RepID=UPI0014724A58|nr:nucleolar protein 8 isoform X2 [Thalassophryne amazonica]